MDQVSHLAGPRRGAILLVEDRDDVRQGLSQLLSLHGYVVRDAATGEQALDQLSTAPGSFALILLDLVLPGAVSGRDLRAMQLADARTALVPTVVVSACEPEVQMQRQLQLAAWIEKPIRFDQLLAVVSAYVMPEN